MKVSFEISEEFNVNPQTIYDAWLNSEKHEAMTGGVANCSQVVGATFTAWDGYISGINQELVESKKIVQTWRTSEFKDEDEDSKITILLEPTDSGCKLTLIHENIPEGQPDYAQGWVEHYIEPMKQYFK